MHVAYVGVFFFILIWSLHLHKRSRKLHENQEIYDAALQRGVVRLPYELQCHILSHVACLVDLSSEFPHKGLWQVLCVSRDMHHKMMPFAYSALYLRASISINRLRYTLVAECPFFATYVRHISICHCEDLAPLALEQLLLSTTHVTSMHLDGASAGAMCMTQAGRLSEGAKPMIVSWDVTAHVPESIQLEVLSNFTMWQRVESLYICGDPLLAHALTNGPWPKLRHVYWYVPPVMDEEVSTIVQAWVMRKWSKRGVFVVWNNRIT